MVKIIDRGTVGLRAWRNRKPRSQSPKKKGFTLHIVGSGKIARPHARCDDLVRDIQRWHQNDNGWSDGAYNFCICPHGSIYAMRGWTWDQFANTPNGTSRNPRLEPAQDNWITVCLLMGCGDEPTVAAMDAFEELRRAGIKKGMTLTVTGHRDFKQKECPCDSWYEYAQRLSGRKVPSSTAVKVKKISRPAISLSKIREAAVTDPPRNSRYARYPTGTKVVEAALVKEGLLSKKWRDPVGHFGSETVKAYAAWQRRQGFRGRDADGVPGLVTLRKLGDKYGFRVKG